MHNFSPLIALGLITLPSRIQNYKLFIMNIEETLIVLAAGVHSILMHISKQFIQLRDDSSETAPLYLIKRRLLAGSCVLRYWRILHTSYSRNVHDFAS